MKYGHIGVSLVLCALVANSALAAPTFATPTSASETHTGIIGACSGSWCSFDAGTGLVSCDVEAFCGANNGALAAITDPLVSSGPYNWVATVECQNLATSSCTIDDASAEVDGFRMRGTATSGHADAKYPA
jgi:hypothetical protein